MEAQELQLIHDLADREAIRDVMYRYGRGVDSVNLEAVLATFDDPSNLVVQSGAVLRSGTTGARQLRISTKPEPCIIKPTA